LSCVHVDVEGLMTIAPLGSTPDETAELARRTFSNLRTIRDELARESGRPLRELSMGMSADYAIAIAEGSTLLRVGTALFGPRG
jgi:PLP dependent protein